MKQFILAFVMLLSLSFSSFAASNNPPDDVGDITIVKHEEALILNQKVNVSTTHVVNLQTSSVIMFEDVSGSNIIKDLETNQTIYNEWGWCFVTVPWYPYWDIQPCLKINKK